MKKSAKRGDCKTVKRKNGCTIQLCYTGGGLTGWTFVKDSGSCPGGKRKRAGR